MRDCVYRICEAEVWAAAEAGEQLPLSELDRRDGYVHLSTAAQLEGTLRRHFAGRDDLVVLTIACSRLLDGTLRFEPPTSPGGEGRELYPHFYGRIPIAAIIHGDRLTLDDRGRHRLPAVIERAAADERDELEPLQIRVVWDEQRELVLLEYPKPTRIEDEAGIYAWEAMLERRISAIVEARGGKVPVVIGLDNLWIAPKLERRYAELADKVISRWFSSVARWTTEDRTRRFFTRANDARSLPSEVFDSREQALAFVLSDRAGSAARG